MINQEEYKILKGLDDRYKWIARDSEHSKDYSGEVLAYAEKPDKCNGIIWSDTWGYEHLPKHLFQFIQWPDEEPHNIQELIDEYEKGKDNKESVLDLRKLVEDTNNRLITSNINADEEDNKYYYAVSMLITLYKRLKRESEETEVKLNKEWLRRKVTFLPTETSEYMPHGEMVDQQVVLSLINQLDEPEITEEKAWEVLGDKFDWSAHGLKHNVVKLIETLEDGVLMTDIIKLGRGNKIIIEKPAIPQFAADWINKYNEYGYGLYQALKTMENNARSWRRIYDWYRENTLEFVMAYLTRDYEIEKQPHSVLKAFDEKAKEYENHRATSVRVAELRQVVKDALEEAEI